jgi:hypothetical protein
VIAYACTGGHTQLVCARACACQCPLSSSCLLSRCVSHCTLRHLGRGAWVMLACADAGIRAGICAGSKVTYPLAARVTLGLGFWQGASCRGGRVVQGAPSSGSCRGPLGLSLREVGRGTAPPKLGAVAARAGANPRGAARSMKRSGAVACRVCCARIRQERGLVAKGFCFGQTGGGLENCTSIESSDRAVLSLRS